MTSAKKQKVMYWTFTLLFILPLAGSGIGFLTMRPAAIEGMTHLGYPVYVIRFLGLAKVLGVLAVLAGTFPKIKEWAYAGLVFNLLGASYSHLCSGDGPKALGPLVILSFALLSYSNWRKFKLAEKPTSESTFGPEITVAGAAH